MSASCRCVSSRGVAAMGAGLSLGPNQPDGSPCSGSRLSVAALVHRRCHRHTEERRNTRMTNSNHHQTQPTEVARTRTRTRIDDGRCATNDAHATHPLNHPTTRTHRTKRRAVAAEHEERNEQRLATGSMAVRRRPMDTERPHRHRTMLLPLVHFRPASHSAGADVVASRTDDRARHMRGQRGAAHS